MKDYPDNTMIEATSATQETPGSWRSSMTSSKKASFYYSLSRACPVAVEPAPRTAITVTGWIVNEVDAAMLGADATLQHRYRGVGARAEGAHDR
ncbi:MAG TPA: hypothetical protein VFR23_19895 [Jiangellaceae bacterium]|nr:hypothetical protein [Jiangellaceae bacterium]